MAWPHLLLLLAVQALLTEDLKAYHKVLDTLQLSIPSLSTLEGKL